MHPWNCTDFHVTPSEIFHSGTELYSDSAKKTKNQEECGNNQLWKMTEWKKRLDAAFVFASSSEEWRQQKLIASMFSFPTFRNVRKCRSVFEKGSERCNSFLANRYLEFACGENSSSSKFQHFGIEWKYCLLMENYQLTERCYLVVFGHGFDRAADYGNIVAAASRIKTHGAHHCRHRPAHHHLQQNKKNTWQPHFSFP